MGIAKEVNESLFMFDQTLAQEEARANDEERQRTARGHAEIAGKKSMERAGRKHWNQDDIDAARREFEWHNKAKK